MQASIIAALAALAVGIASLLRAPRHPLNQIFSALCAGTFVAHFSILLQGVTDDFAWVRLKLISLSSVALLVDLFFRRFPDGTRTKAPSFDRTYWFAIALLAASAFLPEKILQGALFEPFPLHVLFSKTISFLTMGQGIRLLFFQYRTSQEPLRRERLKILLATSVLTILGMLLQQIPVFPPIGSIALVIYLYFLHQALSRYRLLDLQEMLARGVVITLQGLLFASLFWALFALSRVQPETPRNLDGTEETFFTFLIVIGIVLILYDPLRKGIEHLTAKSIFRKRRAFEDLIQQTREILPAQLSTDEMIRTVLENLRQSRRITDASVYLMEEEFSMMRLRGHCGENRALPQVIVAPPFLSLTRRPKPLIPEILERVLPPSQEQGPSRDQKMLRILHSLNTQATFPMVTGDGRLMGILNLKDQHHEEGYSNSEIRLLMTLAGQMASVCRNLQVYNQILERERLVELGQMAAGLAHEIRNPLGAIKGAAQLLDKEAPQENRFLHIIVEESNRLNRVLEDFLDFARSEKKMDAMGDVNALLTKIARVVEGNGLSPGISIRLDLATKLPLIPIRAERMKQVFLNLAMNALQAMPQGGTLSIASRALESGGVEIVFSDSGSGIPDENLEKIFAPFFTTKENGSGLGLAICKRIVSDHGGEIDVMGRCKEGGASFRIRLKPQPPAGAPS